MTHIPGNTRGTRDGLVNFVHGSENIYLQHQNRENGVGTSVRDLKGNRCKFGRTYSDKIITLEGFFDFAGHCPK